MKKSILLTMCIFYVSSTFAFGFKFNLFDTPKIKNYGSYRAWSNGNFAPTCNVYKVSNYTGDIGDGIYRIKPNSNPAFDVYCDMTTNGGGWTAIIDTSRTTTLADTRNYLNNFGDRSNIQSTEYQDSNGYGWADNTRTFRSIQLSTIPSSLIKDVRMTISGWYNNLGSGSLGTLNVSSQSLVGYLNGDSFAESQLYFLLSDGWAAPTSGQAYEQALIYRQNGIMNGPISGTNNVINQTFIFDYPSAPNSLWISMAGYTGYLYSKRYISKFYVR